MNLADATGKVNEIVTTFSGDAVSIAIVIVKAIFLPLIVIGAVSWLGRLFMRKAQGR